MYTYLTLLYLSLGADTYGFLNISFQCFIHYSLSVRSHRTISADSCSSVINLKRNLIYYHLVSPPRMWCAYDPSAYVLHDAKLKNHPMDVSAIGLAYWPMDLNFGPSQVSPKAYCEVHTRFWNARIHTVYLPKMDASKVFFERSTDYHSQQRNLGFFLEFDYKANKGDISSGGPDQRPAF